MVGVYTRHRELVKNLFSAPYLAIFFFFFLAKEDRIQLDKISNIGVHLVRPLYNLFYTVRPFF